VGGSRWDCRATPRYLTTSANDVEDPYNDAHPTPIRVWLEQMNTLCRQT
jgi:hypothetical protein